MKTWETSLCLKITTAELNFRNNILLANVNYFSYNIEKVRGGESVQKALWLWQVWQNVWYDWIDIYS